MATAPATALLALGLMRLCQLQKPEMSSRERPPLAAAAVVTAAVVTAAVVTAAVVATAAVMATSILAATATELRVSALQKATPQRQITTNLIRSDCGLV